MRALAWIAGLAGAVALDAAPAFSLQSAPVSSRPAVGRLDEEAFRRGLRDRGLVELLDLYDRENPPADEPGRRLRKRDVLLGDCADPRKTDTERAAACGRASAVLEALLAEFPDDPDRFAWQLELGRDLVERHATAAVEAMLFRVASPAQKAEVLATSTRAAALLERLLADVASEWTRLGALPPDRFDAVAASGRLKVLESIEAGGAYLLAWARLYGAMCRPSEDPRRAEVARQILEEVVTRRRWTATPHDKTGLQMQSLVLAAAAARLGGQYDIADAAGQQAVSLYSRMPAGETRSSLDRWALLAVLERIRLLRDRGQTAEAVAAVERAREWAEKSRAEDTAARVSLGVLARLLNATAGDSLPAMARTRPDLRPLIYESIGRLRQERGDGKPVDAFDVLGAAWVAAEERDRLDEAVSSLRAAEVAGGDAFVASEGLFLQARCGLARGRRTDAIRALLRLSREYPASDRATAAIEDAVRLAVLGMASVVTQPVRDDADGSLALMVEAAQLLRERVPTSPRLPEATFAAGVALQRLDRWAESAAEYARVPAQHELAAEAGVRRVRCLAAVFDREPGEAAATAVVQAAGEAQRRIESLPESRRDLCAAAEVVLLRARVQSGSVVGQHEAALATLAGFEQRYAACRGPVGAMWRVRVHALESLGRLQEAGNAAHQLLAADPESAVPVMDGLLARMQERLDQLRSAGDADGLRELAVEAARLAASLEQRASGASARRPTSPLRSASRPTVESLRVARAMALLDADQAAEACRLMEGLPAGEDDPVRQFLRAECLYRAGQYREALPVYHRVWQASEDGTPLWWRALLRNLQCHTEAGTDAGEILQSIRQHQDQHRDFGGPGFRRQFEALQKRNEQRRAAS